jgi:hypothetical protein
MLLPNLAGDYHHQRYFYFPLFLVYGEMSGDTRSGLATGDTDTDLPLPLGLELTINSPRADVSISKRGANLPPHMRFNEKTITSESGKHDHASRRQT